MILHEWLAFYSAFFEYPPKRRTYSAGRAGATWNCSRLGASSVHFMQSHIRKVYACLAVTCHLHLWQNDRDLLRATAVTRGWNGYRNKSQHRKSTLEKKFSRRSCSDSNPRPFNHESGALTTELSPPRYNITWCVYSLPSPWYTRPGWLGVKHQLTYLLFACFAIQFIMLQSVA